MSLPTLDYGTPSTPGSRPPLSILERCSYFALGVVLPMVCFGFSFKEYPGAAEWQVGKWAYVTFVPEGRAGFPFYPLLIFSMSALALFVFRPAFSRHILIRLGLYTGIVLSLQYTLIQATVFSGGRVGGCVVAVALGLGSSVILLGLLRLVEKIPRPSLPVLIAALFCIALVLFAARRDIRHWLPISALAVLVLAPAWCAGVYTRAALVARRLHRQESRASSDVRAWIVAWIAWLTLYAGAWRWSISNAARLYASLPTSAPGCYIATAAAAGHQNFVGSTASRAADGSIFAANGQLRRLKCVEIALAAAWPTGHRLIRRIYDRAGPPSARVIASHPLLADIAFVALKPIEWLAFGLLILAVPRIRQTANALYPPAQR